MDIKAKQSLQTELAITQSFFTDTELKFGVVVADGHSQRIPKGLTDHVRSINCFMTTFYEVTNIVYMD